MNVYEKLLQVQQKLKAPKSQYNKFGDFHYRSCEDIQEAVKPLLEEVKAVLLITDEIVPFGSRFYIKATAIFQDTESPEQIINSAYARETEERPKMDAAQLTGSCSSYARKYALNGLFCIDDAKDPDYSAEEKKLTGYQNGKIEQRSRQQTPTQTKQTVGKDAAMAAVSATSNELEALRQEAYRTGTDIMKVCERYGVSTVGQLTSLHYKKAMSAFSKMPSIQQDAQYELDFNGMEGEMPFR